MNDLEELLYCIKNAIRRNTAPSYITEKADANSYIRTRKADTEESISFFWKMIHLRPLVAATMLQIKTLIIVQIADSL